MLVIWGFQTWLVTWGVCAPQNKKVYKVSHTTGSQVNNTFTNIIEHFEISATRLIKIKQYINRIWEFKHSYYYLHLFTTYWSLLHSQLCIC